MKSDSSSPSKKKRFHRLLKFGKVTGYILVSLFLIAWAYRTYFMWQAEKLYNEVSTYLDKTDPHWRWEEILERRPQLEDSNNSAPLILEIAKLIPEEVWERANWNNSEPDPVVKIYELEPNSIPNKELIDQLDLKLELAAPALQKMRDLANAPIQGKYFIEWGDLPYSAKRSELSLIKNTSNLIEIDTLKNIIEGDIDQALTGIQSQIIVARSLNPPIDGVSLSVRNFVFGKTVQLLERVIAHSQTETLKLAQIRSLIELELKDSNQILLDALRGDRAMSFHTLGLAANQKMSLRGMSGFDSSQKSYFNALKHWLLLQARLITCQSIATSESTRIIETIALPKNKRLEKFHIIEKEIKEVAANISPRWQGLGYISIGGLIMATNIHQRVTTKLEITNLAIAAELFRLENNRWPGSLKELVPNQINEIPMDRYSGEKMKMKTLVDGIIIYSVGEDLKDDGGIIKRISYEEEDENSEIGEDLGFRLWDLDRRH